MEPASARKYVQFAGQSYSLEARWWSPQAGGLWLGLLTQGSNMAERWRRIPDGLSMAVIGTASRPSGGGPGADEFDHELFGLSEEEAEQLPAPDKLLMTVAWEALEHAGLPPLRVSEDRTAVFVGADGPSDEWLLLGSYGAPVAVCPSSGAALQLAAESLRGEKCRTALAAVNDPAAGGCAVVVLREADAARRDGDRVLALVESAQEPGSGGAGPDPGLLLDLVGVIAAREELTLTHPDGRVRVEAAPAEPPAPQRDFEPLVLCALSGTSAAGLRADAERLAELLASPRPPHPADIAWTLARHRAHLPERAVVVARERGELEAGLRAVAAGASAPGVVTGRAVWAAARKAVWVFSGDGSQWTGMGRELLECEPAFGAFLTEVDPVFRAEGGYSPLELLTSSDVGAARGGRLQGLCFAMQAALSRVWLDHGVEPAAVIGHSGGEIAAAVAAGALSPADGALLVCRRSALLPRTAGAGTMALVDLPPAEVEAALRDRTDVVVGIRASSLTTVISGDVDAVEQLTAAWAAQGRFVRTVATDIAPHSPHMDPLLDEVRAALAGLAPRPPRVPLYSTVLDDPRTTALRDAQYWAGNLRNTVRFDVAVAAAAEDGHRIFLEISGHPLVTQAMQETLGAHGVDDAVVLPTLLRNRPEQSTVFTHLGALHCHGAAVDLTARHPGGRLVDLPARAWRRPAADGPDGTRQPDGPERRTDWQLLPPDELRQALTDLVRDLVAAQLGLKPAELDNRRPLAEHGMESVASLAIRRRLAEHLGLPLPATLLWNHPTVDEVVPALAARLDRSAAPEPAPAEDTAGPSGFELLLSDIESDGDAL
ncbi:acyltransferase domain-containing protein [Streptomyces sp. NPDC050803]|uniref:acyltransferase domain-containing protein n=1 Tax=unclassified Streptomyces TaxID=2593676 RepID=UPI0034419624